MREPKKTFEETPEILALQAQIKAIYRDDSISLEDGDAQIDAINTELEALGVDYAHLNISKTVYKNN